MSKSDIKDTIENELSHVSEELIKLSKATKLKDILKKHKTIKTDLDNSTKKLNDLKESFESEQKDSQKENIDDETFDKYSKEIAEMLETNLEDLDLESQIKKFKTLSKKIFVCESYLKSKKMEIIDCDKVPSGNTKLAESELDSCSSNSVSSDEE